LDDLFRRPASPRRVIALATQRSSGAGTRVLLGDEERLGQEALELARPVTLGLSSGLRYAPQASATSLLDNPRTTNAAAKVKPSRVAP
jgi:hypothetical protein